MNQFICFPPLEILDAVEFDSYDGEATLITVYRAPITQWTKIPAVAIHALSPTERELELYIEDAAAKGFESIIVYGEVA
jgi:hypothetical protein